MTVISVVTGTYNRLSFLQRMVESCRRQLVGIPYEFVLVDGGSTDGTLDWCAKQSDVRLIAQGELLGAIKAFCDGAKAAVGEYVMLANDDIEVQPGAILSALAHLERTPRCGGVAFADNRPAPGYEHTIWHVQSMRALDANHRPMDVIYAQVGLFRRFLGEAAGWWGADDSVMGNGKQTYGGDNFLSSRIWEMGYTIDALNNARVRDLVPQDGLRAHNAAIEEANPGRYYVRFPHAPKVQSTPQLPNPQSERLRVLYLPIYEPHSAVQKQCKRGLREAFGRLGLVAEVDYVNNAYNLPELVEQFQPHLLFTQCHAANSIPLSALARARGICPEMVVVNWDGDVYEPLLTSDSMLSFLRHVDLQLVVNASVLPTYERVGIRSTYWQVAYEPVDEDDLPDVPYHDVLFLANCYSDDRRRVGELISRLPGVNAGVYGRGWGYFGHGDTTYNFPAGAALYHKTRIAIGDNQYPADEGFVSNRLFEAMANGAFLLHQEIKGLEKLTDIKDGVHYVSWRDTDDLQDKIRHYLGPRFQKDRRQIADNGKQFVREHHSFDARVRQLIFELLPMIERVKT